MRLDEVARVEPFGTTDERGYNVGTQPLAIGDDGILRLVTKIMDKENTVEKGLKLLKKRVYLVEERFAVGGVGNDGVNHVVVSFHNSLILVLPTFVALIGKTGCLQQLVSNTAKGTDDYNDFLVLCLALNNAF